MRSHEPARATFGGSYAGAPSYTYSRGPDGQRCAVAVAPRLFGADFARYRRAAESAELIDLPG